MLNLDITQIWIRRLISLAVVLLLYMAAFKGIVAVDFAGGDSIFALPGWAMQLKKVSQLAAVPLAVIFWLVRVPLRKLEFTAASLVPLMIFVHMISFVRGLAIDLSGSLPEIIPIAVLGYVFVLINFAVHRIGYKTMVRAVADGLLVFSCFYIICNFILTVQGYGYSLGAIRAAGITAHPNMLGLNAGLLDAVVFGYILKWGWKARLALVPILIAGTFLVVASGSRTGALGEVLAIIVLFWTYRGYPLNIVVLLAMGGLIVMGGLAFANLPQVVDLLQGTPLVRGGGSGDQDSRSGAWAILFKAISANPVFGAGQLYDIDATENSYLRGWAAFGIVYLVPLCAMTFMMVKRYMTMLTHVAEAPLFLGVAVALVCAEYFDGQMEDRFSSIMIILVLLGAVSKAGWVKKRSPAAKPAMAVPAGA